MLGLKDDRARDHVILVVVDHVVGVGLLLDEELLVMCFKLATQNLETEIGAVETSIHNL